MALYGKGILSNVIERAWSGSDNPNASFFQLITFIELSTQMLSFLSFFGTESEWVMPTPAL